MDKSVLRRLDALQQIADRNRPCNVTVTFADGSTTTTDPVGVIEMCRERELGEIKSITTDQSNYVGLICTLDAVFGGGADAQH